MNSAKPLTWFFINTLTRQRFDGLKFDQARSCFEKIPVQDRSKWLVLSPHQMGWISLAKCEDFLEFSVDSDNLPDADRRQLTADDQKNDPKSRRRLERYDATLEVIITSGKKSFRSRTRNISMGGILLEDKVPFEILGELCNVLVKDSESKSNIRFRALSLSNSDGLCRFSFEDGNALEKQKLLKWVETILKKAQKAA